MNRIHTALLTVMLVLMSCEPSATLNDVETVRPLPTDTSWALSRQWDDGLAEVASYDAFRNVYGKRRQYDLTMITVKEVFNQQFDVKTDDYKRNDLFTVMKVNLSARIETDVYPYHYLTSMFFRRETPHLVHKITNSSQEWCGNTFKYFRRTDSGFHYTYNSYWDQEGVGERSLVTNAVFEDQLLYTLRALPFTDETRSFTAEVIASVITNKANPTPATTCTFTMRSDILEPSMFGTASTFPEQECWRVDMERADGVKAQWWFSKDPERALLRFRHDDGRLMMLRSLKRSAYWLSE